MKNNIQKSLEIYLIEKQQAHYRYVYSIIKNQDDALDVIQDSIFKALKKCHHLKDEKSMNAWFYRILMTTAYDQIRKYNRSGMLVPDIEEVSINSYMDKYTDIDLEKAIASLTSIEQTALRFRYYEDMKLEEVACILDENISTVKTRIYSALKKLRNLLKQDFKEVD